MSDEWTLHEAQERLRYLAEWAEGMIHESQYPQYGRDVKTLLETPIEELRACGDDE